MCLPLTLMLRWLFNSSNFWQRNLSSSTLQVKNRNSLIGLWNRTEVSDTRESKIPVKTEVGSLLARKKESIYPGLHLDWTEGEDLLSILQSPRQPLAVLASVETAFWLSCCRHANSPFLTIISSVLKSWTREIFSTHHITIKHLPVLKTEHAMPSPHATEFRPVDCGNLEG